MRKGLIPRADVEGSGLVLMASRIMVSSLECDPPEKQRRSNLPFKSNKTVRDEVLPSPEKLQLVTAAKKKTGDPSLLSVREQWVGGKRYIVCYNEDQARKDAADRAAIVESLKEKLKNGDKSLVGNKGYRRYLKSAGRSTSRLTRPSSSKRSCSTGCGCFAPTPRSLPRMWH
jgi:hypothetical protein